MGRFSGARFSVSFSAFAIACVTAGFVSRAHANVVSGSSEGYGASATASAVGSLVTLNVNKSADSAGSAPGIYSVSKTDINLNANAGINIGLAAVTIAGVNGTLSSSASSNINGSAGAKFTQATAEVDGLSVPLGSVVLLNSNSTFLSLNASVVTSSAQVSGDFPLLTVAGDSILTDLTLNINGTPFNLAAYVDGNGRAAPNTTLGVNVLGVAGLTIILNEQIATGNSISVNAIHITANAVDTGVSGLGLLSADIVIAHSDAQMTAVPEPASLSILGASASALLLRRRRTA